MRAAPPVQVTLTRCGVWHAALVVLTLADLGCLAAWATLRSTPLPIALLAALTLVGVASVVAASSARARPAQLRWDGQSWRLGSYGQPADSMHPGRLGICLDIGFWMLLRFVPTDGGWASVVWLPVQRRDMKDQWHPLRCGIFSPVAAASTEQSDPTQAGM